VPFAVEQIEQVAVGAGGTEQPVEALVQLGEPDGIEVSAFQRAHLLVERGGLVEAGGAQQWSRERGGHSFEVGEHLHGVGVDAGDLGTDVGREGDESFGLKPPDGFAYRDRTDCELARELVEHEPVAGAVASGENALAQLPVHGLGFRERAGVWHECPPASSMTSPPRKSMRS
jgi:hypothetical protein